MMNELRFALRSLLKTPGFTAIARHTPVLGIGVNTRINSEPASVIGVMPPALPAA